MSKHTAGPWHSAEKSAKSWNIGVYTEQGDEVAHIAVKSALHAHRREADALLIAASPLLLAAAQAVVARWDTPLWKDAPATATYINALRSIQQFREAICASHLLFACFMSKAVLFEFCFPFCRPLCILFGNANRVVHSAIVLAIASEFPGLAANVDSKSAQNLTAAFWSVSHLALLSPLRLQRGHVER